MIAELRSIPPPTFNESVVANTRSFYVSERFQFRFFVHKVRYRFRDGALDTLRLRFWVTDRQAIEDDTNPTGESLLGGYGTRDYVTGNGPATIELEINREFVRGRRLLVDAENTDANPHTVDVQFIVSEVVD